MKQTLLFLFILTLQFSIGQIAYTSFEEPGTGTKYTDTGNQAEDHDLINNSGEAPVDFTTAGTELGFDSWYYNTLNSEGLTDGDYVGVTDYTGNVGSYPDGSQGFQMSDTDGKMTTTFDAVDLSGYSNVTMSLKYYAAADQFESGDTLYISVIVDGSTEIEVFKEGADDLDALGGSWQTVTQDLSGYSSAQLKVELQCNSSSEWVYFDDIEFVEGAADTEVKFASAEASVGEDAGTYNLLVSIVNPDASNATTADVVLISGDAADIDNYTTQTVTFPAGSSSDQTVVITITDDSENEGNEVLTFELQNVSGGKNASAGSPSQFNLTIEDNDFAATPNIVINEILQNPSAVDDLKGEWFELFNPTDSAVDINGWTIKDDGIDSHIIDNGGPLMISAGGYLVLGNNDTLTVNGGVSVDYVYTGITLSNGGDEVVLIYSDGVSEVDRVNYDGGPNFPDPTGKSMELNNPANDNNDASNWAEATATFGDGDYGTPGAQNSTFINSIERRNPVTASSFKLYAAFPNPFNPSTTLRFDVPLATDNIELTVYDVLGQKVKTLYSGAIAQGQYTAQWNGTNQNGQSVPSGIYFGVLKSNSFNQTIKMMLLK